jgi:signal transduction histidine kinase
MQFTTQTHQLKPAGISKASVYGDRERISQVLINLISNAIKYSPNANRVEIFTSVERRDGIRSVKFSVQDFGVGIPKTQQKKIFERFYRATPSTKFSGLGLGLYISSQIIKRHGGKIWVENSTDKGSRFSFALPVQKPTTARKKLSAYKKPDIQQ